MAEERISADRQTDLRILPNEFAWVMDGATGAIKTYVGPLSTSLQQAERQVAFNTRSGRFETTLETQQKIVAPEGWYVVLRNPTVKGDHPVDKSNTAPELHHGRIVNVPGPVSFALWPGQVADVIEAHRLRADSYLVARIYNVEEANKWLPKWNERIAQKPAPTPTEGSEEEAVARDYERAPGALGSFTMGQLLIIQGDVWEFFLPPTGIEVIYDAEKRSHVRDAVSLERLEYCLLRDQNGNKRYVQGPAIVFPKPTEDFVRDGDAKKFRATELGPKQGVYIKVIAPYTDGDEEHSVGEELFITGEDTPIYFPRVEHMLIRYGSQEVHSGVAIPAGSALYVMDRMKGEVRIEKGPNIFLPDPRSEVVIKRNLPLHICALLYPGNEEALVANGGVPAAPPRAGGAGGAEAPLRGMSSRFSANASYTDGSTQVLDNRVTRRTDVPQASSGFKGDSADRLGQYKAPRTITLGGKYDGAVGMDVWSGYAVMLVDKTGGRRVVVGPKTAILDYDELPHMVTLSTGRPKNMDNPRREAYLRVDNNYVTDVIEAETSDYCTVNVKLVYRVNFVGEDQFKWFSVENYVKLLCDHMRSMVRNAVRKQTVKRFYESATDIIRDLVLGASEEGERPGRLFEENGMRVIDVEVLKVSLADRIQKLIESREVQTLERDLQLGTAKAMLDNTREMEALKLEELMVREKTREVTEELARRAASDKFHTDQLTVETRRQLSEIVEGMQQATARHQAALDAIKREERMHDSSLNNQIAIGQQKLELELMEKEATESARKFAAISPQLIAALQAVGDQSTLTRVAEAMGAQGLLRTMGGDSVADVLANILKGTTLGERLPHLLSSASSSNGHSASLPAE